MAVGKGSLLRAANAAGKAKTEENVNRKESGIERNHEVDKDVKQEAEELNKENDLAKEKKQSKNKSAKKQEISESKSAKKSEQMQEISEHKSVKKSEQIQEISEDKSAKKQEQMNEASGKEKKISAKSGRKKAEEKHRLTEQKAYLYTVSAKELRAIPQEWRSQKYVCPNVSKLAESISRCGILEPLPVVQTGEMEYQLVGGSRRMQVIQMLGIREIPVLVLPGSSQEDAKKLYQELSLLDEEGLKKQQDKTQNKQNEKSRRTGLFGSQRIPEYLL